MAAGAPTVWYLKAERGNLNRSSRGVFRCTVIHYGFDV